mmetsp:Transcript_51403/g.143480  ORF Transcript_51403/g.143480 Transcript_51403/m.143480 type:complete len:226 (-) Transcript_51403:488-1165(-)
MDRAADGVSWQQAPPGQAGAGHHGPGPAAPAPAAQRRGPAAREATGRPERQPGGPAAGAPAPAAAAPPAAAPAALRRPAAGPAAAEREAPEARPQRGGAEIRLGAGLHGVRAARQAEVHWRGYVGRRRQQQLRPPCRPRSARAPGRGTRQGRAAAAAGPRQASGRRQAQVRQVRRASRHQRVPALQEGTGGPQGCLAELREQEARRPRRHEHQARVRGQRGASTW